MKALSHCLLLAAFLLGCKSASDTYAESLGNHRGAVLSVPPAAVWAASKDTLAPLGTVEVEEGSRTASARTSAGNVTVRVEPYDAAGTKSILRVSANHEGEPRPELADQIQLAIQRSLLPR